MRRMSQVIWVYDIKNETGKGIFPDDFFTDTWEMEGAGYNKFQSSNPQIIRHDNLLVNRDTMPQKVTITSLLSSQRYGAFAKKHPNNEKLQKLYQQHRGQRDRENGIPPVYPFEQTHREKRQRHKRGKISENVLKNTPERKCAVLKGVYKQLERFKGY